MSGKEKTEKSSEEHAEELNREVEENIIDELHEVIEENIDEQDEEVDELTRLNAELEEAKDKHLRLYSEFENYRRRTAKERLDLIKTASEDLLIDLLPILDDFERGKASFTKDVEVKDVKEGFDLIFNKFNKTLDQKGVKPMDIGKGSEFDAELHEAISQIPAPKDKLKGKIMDVVEKGYMLNEKVIRFAKVVIGS